MLAFIARMPRPALAFAGFALVFGAVFASLTPSHDAPDEPRHLQRSWLASLGQLGVPSPVPGEGAAIPTSLLELHAPYTKGTRNCRHRGEPMFAGWSTPLAPERTNDEIRTPILYGPVGYLTHALALAPARGLGASAGQLFYLARFANLFTWLALCTAAIGLAPVRRYALATAALLPMSLFQASVVSGDAATNALALLVLALVLRASAEPVRAKQRTRAALLGAIALLGLSKPGYSLLALLVFAIPAAGFATSRRRRGFIAAALVVGIAVPLAWWVVVQLSGPFPYPAANPVEQLRGLAQAPWRVLSVVGGTLVERPGDYWRSTVGILGRLDVVLPTGSYLAYGLLLIASTQAPESEGVRAASRSRAVYGGVALIGCIAIATLLYVSATPVGAPRVAGIQGRYFLPFIPVALAAIPIWKRASRLRNSWKVDGRWIEACWALGLSAASFSLWTRYYGG